MIYLDYRIPKRVSYYVRKFNTRNPFEIADYLNILYQIGDIGCDGCYMFLKNHRYIFLNQNLSKHDMILVMAHELGHAILHRKQDCYFIKHNTLLLNSKIELEANKFAIELLISDDDLAEYKYYIHRFYRFHISGNELLKQDTFVIDGRTYHWMSIAEMEQDKNIMEKNGDIVGFVKQKGYI